ncbi:synaptogenesis protein syg-2 [Strongylocentrotus purpuratus]|uniref:Fibronectin type-III domain-containing protein n=1 Tax=Strongylocentrotus purpuratus TaxID=7668 RepID=A0A7M7NAE1_STRPU|nr:synaptogenesis protein syg-2 [Strongylocentrotus purpuratus]
MLIISDVHEINNGNYECLANTDYGEGIAVINFTYSHPDSPFGFEVNQSQTTSSSLFVAWQPGFDGGSLQTFTLKYCTHDNALKDQDCGIVSHLNTTNHQLRGLNSSTWYRLVLWAINDAGSSSTQETVASTAEHVPVEKTNMADSFIVTFGIGLLAGACFIMIPLIVAVRVFGVSCCLKKSKDEPETGTTGQPIHTRRDDGDELVYIDVSHETTSPPQPIRPARTEETHTVYASLDHDATSRRKEEKNIATTTTATVESQQVDDDGLVYIALSHDTSHPRKSAHIPSSGGTVYASLNFNAMERRKETDDSPTTSTMT